MAAQANRRPSGRALSTTGHRFGTLELRELLAVRGEAGLWLAVDDEGGESLLRLYPGLPTLGEWHALELATSRLKYAADARLVSITEIALDVWPHLSFACADVEPLARRIAREAMAPEAAVAMCADVTGALAALERVGVPPVDIGVADIVLVGERARLLADVGLPGGKLADTCVDHDHVAPERAAAIAERARGVDAPRGADAYPTTASMSYALASIVATAIRGPQQGGAGAAPLPARLEQVLRRGLTHNPSERYDTPAALAEALGAAIGVRLRQRDATAPRGTRARGAGAAVARGPARPGRRRGGIALPAAVLLAAAAIGTIAGSAATAPRQPAAATLAGAGLSVEAPRGWLSATAAAAPAIGAPALVAHPPGSSATALVVTRAAAPLLARLADAVPEPVRLGDDEAWRYRDVTNVGDVYVLEDGDGPVVAACLGPSGARAACAAALTTLRLPAGRAVSLGGEPAVRRQLARVMADLDRARARERHALAAAATGRRQAVAADRLGAAYARAAAAAAKFGTVGAPGELSRLADRLGETGRAYVALASAARATHRRAYAQARDRVTADERALQRDIAALAAAGAGSRP